jgi:hypothetical protein
VLKLVVSSLSRGERVGDRFGDDSCELVPAAEVVGETRSSAAGSRASSRPRFVESS